MCRKLSYLVPYVLALSVALTGTTKAELVGWWRFDEGSGTVAHDTSGNGNDGTFHGDPQWVSGFIGGALEFDGVDDYVETGDLDLTESFTLTFWMRPSSIPSGWHSVVMKEYDYGFEFDGTNLLGRVGNGAGGWGATVTTTISEPAVWYHVALTWKHPASAKIREHMFQITIRYSLPVGTRPANFSTAPSTTSASTTTFCRESKF